MKREHKPFTMQSPHFVYFIAGFIIALAGITVIASLFWVDTIEANNEPADEFPHNYRIISPKVPDELDFCGERVPLEDFEVFERMERELIVNTYFHSSTTISLKRANRWFPVIEPILKKYNIPDDFKYLAVIESGLANLISPARATGYWQFIESAGKQFGLDIEGTVDERYHVEKSTEAACKYLRSAYNKFGSWTVAAASYNMGMAGVERQLERQKTRSYYNLVLNEETSRYMFRILAVKEIMQNPRKYGFDLNEDELYTELLYDEITVNSSISDLAEFAKEQGTNYKMLKYFNPWLRDNSLQNRGGKTYTIKIPKKGTVTLAPDRH